MEVRRATGSTSLARGDAAEASRRATIIEDRVAGAIVGHAPDTVAKAYGTVTLTEPPKRTVMFGIPASTALWWANEIRIWAAAFAALAAVASGVAGYYQIRLASVVSVEKDEAFMRFRTASEERTAIAQAEAARANEAVKLLEVERLRLEARLAPRVITPAQKQAFIDTFKDIKNKAVVSVLWNEGAEPEKFAHRLAEVLRAAGIEASVNKTMLASAHGISITKDDAMFYKELELAFTNAGLEFGLVDRLFGVTTPMIIVGYKTDDD